MFPGASETDASEIPPRSEEVSVVQAKGFSSSKWAPWWHWDLFAGTKSQLHRTLGGSRIRTWRLLWPIATLHFQMLRYPDPSRKRRFVMAHRKKLSAIMTIQVPYGADGSIMEPISIHFRDDRCPRLLAAYTSARFQKKLQAIARHWNGLKFDGKAGNSGV